MRWDGLHACTHVVGGGPGSRIYKSGEGVKQGHKEAREARTLVACGLLLWLWPMLIRSGAQFKYIVRSRVVVSPSSATATGGYMYTCCKRG